MTQLTLFLDGSASADRPFPSLARLLGRGEPLAPCADHRPFAALLNSFGLPLGSDADLPLAALARLGTGQPAEGLWLYADPVHQQADQDKVYLIGRAELSLEENEEALRTLNKLFGEDGWAFHAHAPGHWLLHLPGGEPPLTTPYDQALGLAIGPCLPQARDATPWRRAMTEMQMLLHGCAFNHAREGRGTPPVNGVWLWGAGTLPHAASLNWQGVWGESELVRGMARLHSLSANTPPVDFATWRQQAGAGSHWLHLSLVKGHALETDWFAPLALALRRGELDTLQIDAANGCRWRVGSRQLRRWWRRSPDLAKVLSSLSSPYSNNGDMRRMC